MAAQAGVLASFEEAAERTLRTMCGLRIGESTVQRTTEAAGRKVAEQLQAGRTQGPRASWEWQRDAPGRTCAYLSLDHTGERQQGAGGRRAEGRMAAVALVYNPRSDHDERRTPSRQVRYISGFYELDDVVRQLRREAEAVGLMQADQQIALTDGGAGLEDALQKFFPRAECVLDFWHAKEYLAEPAHALHPTEETRKPWLEAWCRRLKHEGGQAVLAGLEALDLAGAAPQVREVHRPTVTYFRHQAHRMDYPRYVAHGGQIGSGPVESARKTAVGNRLQGGGMRWGSPGADGVCHLPAVDLSQPACWDALWQSPCA